MSLPKNFWEEFDRRLDAKLEPIARDVSILKSDVSNIIKDVAKLKETTTNLTGWTKRQDASIEKELTSACLNHLRTIKQSYLVFSPKRFPHKVAIAGKEITEFDGIIIMTNDHVFYEFLMGNKNADVNQFNPDLKAYLIIVEAKQYLDNKKVTKKLKQREKIIDLLLAYKNGTIVDSSLSNCHFDKFDNNIGMYMGAADYESGTIEKIEKFCTTNTQLTDNRELFGIIELTGSRFTVKDASNGFGKDTWAGGKKNRYNAIKALKDNMQASCRMTSVYYF
jgi:hypothetical protein